MPIRAHRVLGRRYAALAGARAALQETTELGNRRLHPRSDPRVARRARGRPLKPRPRPGWHMVDRFTSRAVPDALGSPRSLPDSKVHF